MYMKKHNNQAEIEAERDKSDVYQVFRHPEGKVRTIVEQEDLAAALAIANKRFARAGFADGLAEHVTTVDTNEWDGDDKPDDNSADEFEDLGITETMAVLAVDDNNFDDDLSIDDDAATSAFWVATWSWVAPKDVLYILVDVDACPEERVDTPTAFQTRDALSALLVCLQAETGLSEATQQAIIAATAACPRHLRPKAVEQLVSIDNASVPA